VRNYAIDKPSMSYDTTPHLPKAQHDGERAGLPLEVFQPASSGHASLRVAPAMLSTRRTNCS